MAAQDDTHFLVNASSRGYAHKYAKISPQDAGLILPYKWHAYRSKVHPHIFYAKTDDCPVGGRRTSIKMHRLILGAPDGMHVDHINGDGLDNRRENLRLVTPQLNQANSRKRKAMTSQFKGVSWHKFTGKWRASFSVNRRQIHLGLYEDEIAAAQAYDIKALEMWGEHAHLNFMRPR